MKNIVCQALCQSLIYISVFLNKRALYHDNTQMMSKVGKKITNASTTKISLLFTMISAFVLIFISPSLLDEISAEAVSLLTEKFNQTMIEDANLTTNNITFAEASAIVNQSAMANITKTGTIRVQDLQSPVPGEIEATGEEETVIPTRAGVDNILAYRIAKVAPTIADVSREQPVATFDPATSASFSTESNSSTPVTAGSENTTLSINSNVNSTTAESIATPKFVEMNRVLNETLDSEQCNCAPGDVVQDVSDNHVFQMANVAGKIWNKNNSNLIAYFALSDFFQTREDFLTDPYIIYDDASRRWFATIFDITTESYPLAVSRTEDPTGEWDIYDIPFVSCPDYGRFAVNEHLLVISVNDFGPGCTNGFLGIQNAIINKQDLINGTIDASSVQITSPDPSHFTMLPVSQLSSNPIMFMVSTDGFGTNVIKLLSIVGQPRSATITTSTVEIEQSFTPPQGRQPDPQFQIDTLDARVSTAAYRNGEIWLAFGDKCDDPERACIRLVQIDTNAKRVLQDFNYAAINADIYHPALTMDNSGNLIMSFGISSPSIYPSLMVTGRSQSDALNTMADPVYLVKGTQSHETNRRGDYHTATTDGKSVWLTGEYNTGPNWSTFIGAVSKP